MTTAVKKTPKTKIRKGDEVQVTSGKAKGQTGKVLRIDLIRSKLFVEGVNMLKKHSKPRREGDKGGIIEIEGAIHLSNVQLLCKSCKKGVRVRMKIEDNGAKNRQCVKCGQILS